MAQLITCSRMGEEGVFEVIWCFLNRENIIFYCNFGVEWQGQRTKDPSSELKGLVAAITVTSKCSQETGCNSRCARQARGLQFLPKVQGHLKAPHKVQHVVSSKIKASQRSMHSAGYHAVGITIRHGILANYTDVGSVCNVQSVFPVRSYCVIQIYYHLCYTF